MKAILIIDMPKKCEDCLLSYKDMETCYCEVTDNEVKYWKKPDDCPLKPMPSKMKIDYDTIASCEVTEKVVAMGWNACIETILKGEENETDI